MSKVVSDQLRRAELLIHTLRASLGPAATEEKSVLIDRLEAESRELEKDNTELEKLKDEVRRKSVRLQKKSAEFRKKVTVVKHMVRLDIKHPE